ncbi:MAG: histidine phosphatase family protein [Burkholderiaceae bacterium]|jgi:probable phosphoglycerate mutase
MTETHLFFIRHGQTDWNQERRIQGQLDTPLNAEGLQQAQRLTALLGSNGQALAPLSQASVIYSSPLSRALQTAQPLATVLKQSITPLEPLQERHFGAIQGKTYPELEANHPVESQKINNRDPDFRPESGESLLDLRARVRGLLELLLRKHAGETVICFTHGGVLDIIYREATSTALEAKRTWAIPNAGVNHLVYTSQPAAWKVQAWAFTRHLEEDSSAPTNADF